MPRSAPLSTPTALIACPARLGARKASMHHRGSEPYQCVPRSEPSIWQRRAGRRFAVSAVPDLKARDVPARELKHSN